MRTLLLASTLLAAAGCTEPQHGRVLLISLDGLGHETWMNDDVMEDMPTLRKIAETGGYAKHGIQPAFTTVTAASHASIWTGFYGNENGITANSIPFLPRSKHLFLEPQDGFRSYGLKKETIWVKAAKQGVRSAAVQATQPWPFNELTTHPNAVVVNSYQPGRLLNDRLLRPSDVEPAWDQGWEACLAEGEQPVSTVKWSEGEFVFRAAIVDGAMYIEHRGCVRLTTHSGFSDPLPLGGGTAYFRLFELSEDGSDFLLYQASAGKVAFHVDGTDAPVDELLQEAGGTVMGVYFRSYLEGQYGEPESNGGDGRSRGTSYRGC